MFDVMKTSVVVAGSTAFIAKFNAMSKATTSFGNTVNSVSNKVSVNAQALASSSASLELYTKRYEKLKNIQNALRQNKSDATYAKQLNGDYLRRDISELEQLKKLQADAEYRGKGFGARYNQPISSMQEDISFRKRRIDELNKSLDINAQKQKRVGKLLLDTSQKADVYAKATSSAKQFATATEGVRGRLKLLATELGITKTAIYSFAALAIVAGIGLLATKIAKASYEIDYQKKKLSQLFGSIPKGEQAWEWTKNFALQGKASVTESIDAFTSLIRLGIQPTAKRMEALKDVALLTGVEMGSIGKAAAFAAHGQFQRMHRTIGIDKRQIMKIAPNAFSGTSVSAQVVDQKAVVNAIFKIFDSPVFKGKAKRMLSGFTGEIRLLKGVINTTFLSMVEAVLPILARLIYPFRILAQTVLPVAAFAFIKIADAISFVSKKLKFLSPLFSGLVLYISAIVSKKVFLFAAAQFKAFLEFFGLGAIKIPTFKAALMVVTNALNIFSKANLIATYTSFSKFIVDNVSSIKTGFGVILAGYSRMMTFIKAITTAEGFHAAMLAVVNALQGNWVSIVAAVGVALAAFTGFKFLLPAVSKLFEKLFAGITGKVPKVGQLLESLNTKTAKLKQTLDNARDVFRDWKDVKLEGLKFNTSTLKELGAPEKLIGASYREQFVEIEDQLKYFTNRMNYYKEQSAKYKIGFTEVVPNKERDKVKDQVKQAVEKAAQYKRLVAYYDKQWSEAGTNTSAKRDILNRKAIYVKALEEEQAKIKRLGDKFSSMNKDKSTFIGPDKDKALEFEKSQQQMLRKRYTLWQDLLDIYRDYKKETDQKMEQQILGGGEIAKQGLSQWKIWNKFGKNVIKTATTPKINLSIDVNGDKGLTDFVKKIAYELYQQAIPQIIQQAPQSGSVYGMK